MSAFPDYGKAPPEYLLTMTELIAGYSEDVQRHICDPRAGIASRESYLPSVKKVIDFAAEILTDQRNREFVRDKVVVLEYTPAWEAWMRYKGFHINAHDVPGGRGWYFESEFPPAVVKRTA